MVRGTNHGGGEIFRARQDQAGTHLACTMGTGSFLGVKRPERGADSPSSAEGAKGLGLCVHRPSVPAWASHGMT